jgi:hypothetical protein
MKKYIYDDATLQVKSSEDVVNRLKIVFADSAYINAVKHSRKNWIGIQVEKVLQDNLSFFQNL